MRTPPKNPGGCARQTADPRHAASWEPRCYRLENASIGFPTAARSHLLCAKNTMQSPRRQRRPGRKTLLRLGGLTSAGIPKQVTDVAASVSNASAGSTSVVKVTFRRDPADLNFSNAQVYVRGYNGNDASVLMAEEDLPGPTSDSGRFRGFPSHESEIPSTVPRDRLRYTVAAPPRSSEWHGCVVSARYTQKRGPPRGLR